MASLGHTSSIIENVVLQSGNLVINAVVESLVIEFDQGKC